ncbi:MAG: VCBS repeat-containing protein [Myxococcales bacterium]|nr:VCBS repeat-containing protein [Myxococcales bacterium]
MRLLQAVPLLVLCAPRLTFAAAWEDATAATIGATKEWSNKLELADINGDGLVDILFANGAGYSSAEGAEQSRVFLNQGAGKPFKEVSAQVLPNKGQTRVIKARDINNDGKVDLLVGNSFGNQSWLYLGDGDGGFTDNTAKLPQQLAGIGDLELGDVDDDGDLDIVLADWGPGDAGADGAVTQLWLGDGAGGFTDATASNMPQVKVSWSWELDLADVDNDYDLDVLVSCKTCSGSFLFHNDGAGQFTDASDQLPQFGNNYEFEPIDLDGDDFVDLITINDGPGNTEHIFLGDGMGGFDDATADLWPADANVPGDDNMVAFLDVDSDGDADFVIAGLFGNDDRLILNDGSGHLSLQAGAFAPADSSGSLGIAVADLDGDHKIDVAFSEGESNEDADRVFLATQVPVDTAGPKVSIVAALGDPAALVVRARVHDNKTPVMPHDFSEVVVELSGGGEPTKLPMTWYGEALWRAALAGQRGAHDSARVCATDAAGNQTCSAAIPITDPDTTTDTNTDVTGDITTGTDPTGDPSTPTTGAVPTGTEATAPTTTAATATDASGDTTPQDDGGGCGCRSPAPTGGAWLLALAALGLRRRRR